MTSAFDASTFREALGGVDPEWLSFGTVNTDAPGGQRAVRFEDEDGSPHPLGVMVDVKLHPGGAIVPCRVLQQHGGAGAGSFHPFVAGDEVLVAVASGVSVILGVLSNSLDAHPPTIAGMDSTGNNVAFLRMQEPYAVESGTALVFRNAKTNAQLVLDPQGGTMLSSGDGHVLLMNADAVALVTGDQSSGLELHPGAGEAKLYGGSASLDLESSGSTLQSSTFTVSTSGSNGAGHGVTLEQVIALLINYTVFLGNQGGVSSLMSSVLATPDTAAGLFTTWLQAMLAPVPFPDGVPMTVPATIFLPAFEAVFVPEAGAVAMMLQSPVNILAAVDVTGGVPGTGRANFLY